MDTKVVGEVANSDPLASRERNTTARGSWAYKRSQETHQFSVARTWNSSNDGVIGAHHPPLAAAGHGPDVPAREVGDWLWVHVGLFVAGVLTPHVASAGNLGKGDVETASGYDLTDASSWTIQESGTIQRKLKLVRALRKYRMDSFVSQS